jgi:hypothetical protein
MIWERSMDCPPPTDYADGIPVWRVEAILTHRFTRKGKKGQVKQFSTM